ncbi:uncharacterized protein LOC131232555 isoform X1 [Magnolia sinica]|uniref:uncharacterized protein LOC131232555 isoform X1 n=1 Tax=Magnolia sinica TaxID=86752 RepID=UPI002659F353|nr:uncharacterized protein LOC131232555 isoform X1 [Magnolia sinica]
MYEDSSSVSTAESALECPTGTDTELIRIGGAELSLIGHDRSINAIRSGEFTIRIIRQSISPLSAAICTVGEHQWPIAKDSPVLRVGPKRFCFTLPGFFYGLTFSDSCLEDDLKRLKGILMMFCSYEDNSVSARWTVTIYHLYCRMDVERWPFLSCQHVTRVEHPSLAKCVPRHKDHLVVKAMSEDGLTQYADSSLCMPGAETEFWQSALPGIENLSYQMLEKITAGQAKSTVWAENSNSISNKVQKAIRMSAVVKLVSKALLKGAIDLNLHVNVVGRILTSTNDRKQCRTSAFASIRVFSDLVDAVETAGRSITSNAKHRITWSSGRYWNFNKSGLTLLLRAVAATAMVHVVRNSIEVGSEFIRPVTDLTSDSCLTESISVEKPVEACGL